MAHYMVRAMTQQETDFEVFFERNVVAVGWSQVNFSQFDNGLFNQILVAYPGLYTNATPQFLGRVTAQIERFKGMNIGDRIVVPYWDSIRLATVTTGGELYDLNQVETTDLANQRCVEYLLGEDGSLATMPRRELSEGLARRLKTPGTAVGDLGDFHEEIDELFQGNNWSTRFHQRNKELAFDFKINIIENICSGNTNLQTGGYGLEDVVFELLKIEGYQVEKFPRSYFEGNGDADLAASKFNRLTGESVKLLLQVKLHSGETNPWGVTQLREAAQRDEFANYRLVLVTTAAASQDLTEQCSEYDISLIDGERFANWLYELIGQISVSTRCKLGICDVPTLLV